MPYEFVEETATADIAFRAWGRDLSEAFTAAADATMNVMVEELDAIRPREERKIELEDDALDMLLFNFLQELIYYKDSEKLILRASGVEVSGEAPPYRLSAAAKGEILDPNRHHPRVDVKAVTLHRFKLEKTGDGWKAFVILDI